MLSTGKRRLWLFTRTAILEKTEKAWGVWAFLWFNGLAFSWVESSFSLKMCFGGSDIFSDTSRRLVRWRSKVGVYSVSLVWHAKKFIFLQTYIVWLTPSMWKRSHFKRVFAAENLVRMVFPWCRSASATRSSSTTSLRSDMWWWFWQGLVQQPEIWNSCKVPALRRTCLTSFMFKKFPGIFGFEPNG